MRVNKWTSDWFLKWIWVWSTSSHLVSANLLLDPCLTNLHRWGIAISAVCEYGQQQMMNHIVIMYPSTKLLSILHRSFHYASPCLWNQLPKELRLPTDHQNYHSSDLTHVSSSFPSSVLALSITPSVFHFRITETAWCMVPLSVMACCVICNQQTLLTSNHLQE